MKKFLSIDWDYFIRATMDERQDLFPDGGNENLPPRVRDFIWDRYYRIPELLKIGIEMNLFAKFAEFCYNNSVPLIVDDSHAGLFNIIYGNTKKSEKFEVYNLDFHHDLYYFETSVDTLNCGNWARLLQEKRKNMQYFWISREDSDDDIDKSSYTPFSLDDLVEMDINDFCCIYLCKSGMWTPPHLDPGFKCLADIISEKTYIVNDFSNVLENREFDKTLIEQLELESLKTQYIVGLDLSSTTDCTSYPLKKPVPDVEFDILDQEIVE